MMPSSKVTIPLKSSSPDTAAAFHACYNSHRVLVDDLTLRDARVALALATQQIVRNGLSLLGVAAPDTM